MFLQVPPEDDATAATLGDSYCALAWGKRLADQSDAATAAAVLGSSDAAALDAREKALADWARKVVRSPNATHAADVMRLRGVGLTDREIFEATAFVAFRVAFSTVNDALGARRRRSRGSPTAWRCSIRERSRSPRVQ